MRTILLAGVTLVAFTSGPVSAQFSDNLIKIGVLTDRSGIYSDINGEGSVVAARLAAEEFGNKVAGAPIEIITGDHQNKADIAANLARGWIDTDKVDVVADVPNSAAALAVQGITRDNKRIFLMSGPGVNRADRQAVQPVRLPLDLGQSCPGRRNRPRARRAGQEELVFRHGRLCLWPLVGSGRRQHRQAAWRHCGGERAPSARHIGLLVLPAAGSGLRCAGHRLRQRRRRHHQRGQAGG
jgi:hypothetical protein